MHILMASLPSLLRVAFCIWFLSATLAPLIGLPRVVASTMVVSGQFAHMTVDPYRPRLYVSHELEDSLVVIDTTSDRVIATVPIGSRPSGLDVSLDGRELYVALNGDNSLAVVDLESLTLSHKILLTHSPGDVVAGRIGRAYVASMQREGGSSLIVDTVNRSQVGLIGSLKGNGAIAISPDRETLYIAERGVTPASILKYSVATDDALFLGESPYSLVGDNLRDLTTHPDNLSLLVSAANPYYVQVLDTQAWTLRGALWVPGYPYSVSLAQEGAVAFVTSDVTTMVSYNMSTFQRIGSYELTQNAREVEVLRDGTKAYVITDTYGSNRKLEAVRTSLPAWSPGHGLTARNIRAGSLTLEWDGAYDSTGVVAYRVYKEGMLLATVPSNIHEFDVSGLLPTTTYQFRIQAGNSEGWTENGTSLNVTTMPDTSAPVWPADNLFVVLSATPYNLTLLWTRATDDVGVAAYRIYQDGSLLSTVEGSSIARVIVDLTPKVRHTFKLEAGDSSDNWSTDGPSITAATPLQSYSTLAYLQYSVAPLDRPVLGRPVVFRSNLTNPGAYTARVTALVFKTDFGSFKATDGLPKIVNVGETKTLDTIVRIPLLTFVENHSVMVSVSWQFLLPYSSARELYWSTEDTFDVAGFLPVSGSRLLAGLAFIILNPPLVALYVLAVLLAVFLVMRRDRRQQRLLRHPYLRKQTLRKKAWTVQA